MTTKAKENEGMKRQKVRVDIVAVQLVKEKTANYEINGNASMTSPEAIAEFLQSFFETADREHFIAVCLNSKNKIICVNVVSVGSLNSSVVHPREVFKAAILSNAAAIIVAHNHPSGDSTPSKEDRSITETLSKAGKILGIPVLDHLIIGDNYYSFAEHGNI